MSSATNRCRGSPCGQGVVPQKRPGADVEGSETAFGPGPVHHVNGLVSGNPLLDARGFDGVRPPRAAGGAVQCQHVAARFGWETAGCGRAAEDREDRVRGDLREDGVHTGLAGRGPKA
jgi:hypothetical protein